MDLSLSGGKTASEGDIILEFAEASKADPLKYQNLRSNYNITKKLENAKGYIYLAKPATHTTLVRVEYPDGLDTADASENRKNLVFRYDGNEAVKGGYVIGMPRSGAEDFDQSLAYTKHASTWDGTKKIQFRQMQWRLFYQCTWYYGGGRTAGRIGRSTGHPVFCSYHGRDGQCCHSHPGHPCTVTVRDGCYRRL